MEKLEIYKVIDELRNIGTTDDIIRDRILNYMEANIDEFTECYEEVEE